MFMSLRNVVDIFEIHFKVNLLTKIFLTKFATIILKKAERNTGCSANATLILKLKFLKTKIDRIMQ